MDVLRLSDGVSGGVGEESKSGGRAGAVKTSTGEEAPERGPNSDCERLRE